MSNRDVKVGDKIKYIQTYKDVHWRSAGQGVVIHRGRMQCEVEVTTETGYKYQTWVFYGDIL